MAENFWQSRNFTRFMKTHDPAHPKLQPQPVKNAEPVAEVIAEAIEEKQAPAAQRRAALADIKAAFEKNLTTEIPYKWDKEFIAAAAEDNTDVMDYLRGKIFFGQDTLDRALAATISERDGRNAAHRLMLWGANPDAPEDHLLKDRKAPSILERAFASQTAGVFEEIVMWSDSTKGGNIFNDYLKRARSGVTGSPLLPEGWRGQGADKKVLEAVELWEEKTVAAPRGRKQAAKRLRHGGKTQRHHHPHGGLCRGARRPPAARRL